MYKYFVLNFKTSQHYKLDIIIDNAINKTPGSLTFAGLPHEPNDANKPNDAHEAADGVKPVAEPPAWQDDPPDDALLLSLDLDALNGSASVRGIPQNMRLHHIRKKCAELESPTNRTYRSSKRLLLDANRNLMYCTRVFQINFALAWFPSSYSS